MKNANILITSTALHSFFLINPSYAIEERTSSSFKTTEQSANKTNISKEAALYFKEVFNIIKI